MASMNNESTPVVRKETKNRISVDFEGKLTFKERLMEKLDLDWEEDADKIETIILNANVMETYSREEYQYGT